TLRSDWVRRLLSVTMAFDSTEPFGSLTMPRSVALPVVCARDADAPPASRQRQSAKTGVKPILSGHLKSRSDRADEGRIDFFFISPPMLIGDGLTAHSLSNFLCALLFGRAAARDTLWHRYTTACLGRSAMRQAAHRYGFLINYRSEGSRRLLS